MQKRNKRCTIDGTGCLYPSSEESSEESGEDSSEEIVSIDGQTQTPARDDEGTIIETHNEEDTAAQKLTSEKFFV